MTLKTSLIITGDSSVAQAAVEELNDNVKALAASTRGAIAPTTQLDSATRGGATSAAAAAASTSRAAAATTASTVASRGAAAAQGALSAATGITAASMTAAGVAAGALEAVLTGGLSLAVTALVTGVTLYASALFDTSEAEAAAEKSAASLASYVNDLGNYFDRATGKIRETNSALLANAALAARGRAQDAADAQAAGQKRAVDAFRQSKGSRLVGTGVYMPGSMGSSAYTSNSDIAAVFASGKNIDAQLRQIAISSSTNARYAAEILAGRGTYVLEKRKYDEAKADERAAVTGRLAPSQRTPTPAPAPASTTTPRAIGTGGVGRSAGATSGAIRASTKEADDSAAALRQLGQDLDSVVARYDPARKAAADFADELKRIDDLAAAYDPSKGVGLSPEDARRYRDAATAANAIRTREAALTPEAKAAAEASTTVDNLVASLRGELAVRQTLDPVEAAMLKHKADLAKLSPELRVAKEQELRGLYADVEATNAVADAARDAEDAKRQLQDAALGALDAIIVGGEKAGDVIGRLAKQLASAAIEATLFGTGPLASLLKGATLPKSGTSPTASADLVAGSVSKDVGGTLDRVFGTSGSFGKTLKNAGIGYGVGGAVGNGVTGALGGALGGKFIGDALGKLLPKLGDFAGPLGSIAGGLIGGVLGKLLTPKAQPGGATVSAVNGAAAMSGSVGSDKAAIAAGSGLAGSVATSINQIVAQLGGTIGSFNVQIGKYKDDLRVNVNGKALGGVTGSGATGFGTDENAAVKFAVAQAVAQGAVAGVSEQVAKALRSSTDVEAALQEALKVQSIEVLLGGIGGQIEKAFKDFEATAKERVRIASAYGFDVVAIEKRNADDRLKLGEELLKGQVGSLKKLIDEMTQGSLFEGTALDKLGVLEGAIGKARADLDAGVEGAGDTLAGLLEQKVAALKDSYGTTGGYADGRAQILDEARAAIAKANARIVEAQAKVTPTSDPALTTTNATLDEIADQNAQLVSESRETNRLLLGKFAISSDLDIQNLARI